MEAALRIERAQPRTKGKSKEEEEKPTEGNAAPKENRKKGGAGKAKTRGGKNNSKQPESIQPDPRWASQLAEIKERLAASNN